METEPIWELVPDTFGRVALVSSGRWWKTLFPVLLSGFVRFRESRSLLQGRAGVYSDQVITAMVSTVGKTTHSFRNY